MADQVLFDFAVPDELLEEVVAKSRDPDVIADISNSIFYDGCIHFNQNPLSASGNVYWNTSSTPGGTVTSPLFVGPLPSNNNPSYSTMASANFAATCSSCSGKGSFLHGVADILARIDALNATSP